MPSQKVLTSEVVGSTWRVQKTVHVNLKYNPSGHQKHILELDIEKYFDRINHDKLM